MHSSRRALTRFSGLLRQRRAIHAAAQASTVNDAEISHFSRLSSEWWDESGEFSFLHRMNPVRVQFIQEKLAEIARDEAPDGGADIQPGTILQGLDVLDIGCGGGLLSESLARLGARTVGIDASDANIAIASLHASADPSFRLSSSALTLPHSSNSRNSLTYLHTTTSALLDPTSPEAEISSSLIFPRQYDVVTSLEVLEHVANPAHFLSECCSLVKPGGHLFLSTMARTPLAYALTILFAEHISGKVSKGTHTFSKYVNPDELLDFFKEYPSNEHTKWIEPRSVFLGDRQRIRHLSSSTTHSSTTPPSSPPPNGASGMAARTSSPLSHSFDDLGVDQDVAGSPSSSSNKRGGSSRHSLKAHLKDLPPEAKRKPIDPELALELRVRWLEAIVLGLKQPQDPTGLGTGVGGGGRKGKGKEPTPASLLKNGETLLRLAENVQKQLESAVEGNEGLRKFMDKYDQHAHFLTPSFALSGVLSDDAESPASYYSNLTPEEIDAFLAEMEPDIRAADRDMREIDELVKKGVTSAGKLSDYEQLEPRLDKLLKANAADIELAASLERRIATLMQKHATSVDTLSELFVAWDDAITGAEDTIVQFEKEKEERKRLGLESE
ncbi:hypothetical protein EST38_g7142 [Candolleomyces aberdarensis]|uniref:Ubiquinone biosynthesis O-methyltransferase, mitochondrial n=1 Tax=Candolleomyces aberdarensis TaxID=2316362 RepID=A0A4Q2DFW2_9AGAR|nr:hypothetical protein EST38_g7142 [Candolleomyces aberdarensis]